MYFFFFFLHDIFRLILSLRNQIFSIHLSCFYNVESWFVLLERIMLYPFLFGCYFPGKGVFPLISVGKGRHALKTLIAFYYPKISSDREEGLFWEAESMVQPNSGLCGRGNSNPWPGQSEGKLTCLIPSCGCAWLSFISFWDPCPCYST